MNVHDEHVAAVIPALNEAEKIGGIVTDLNNHADIVIVVDDGSTDDTGRIARSSGATVVTHETDQGYDQSINDGFIQADKQGASVVFTFDADGQHFVKDVPRILAPIQSKTADIVVGQRPSKARLSEYLFGLYTSSRIGVIDPLCGFKAYRIEVFHDIGCFDSYSTTGTQLMLGGGKHGYTLQQVPIQLAEREDESRFGSRLEANWKIIQSLGRLIWYDFITAVSSN
jgi:glycosyltransferase involved in cell wall biosynthesis